MDGMHDLGGRQGFGPVRHSPMAVVFHAEWEKRANALLALAVKQGIFNMDEYRHAIERMEPRHYVSAGYYERSLTGLLTLLVEKGVVAREELEGLAGGPIPLSRPSAAGRPNAPRRDRFKPGDRVRVKEEFVPGHIRMPAYIRGKTGVSWRSRIRRSRAHRFAHGAAGIAVALLSWPGVGRRPVLRRGDARFRVRGVAVRPDGEELAGPARRFRAWRSRGRVFPCATVWCHARPASRCRACARTRSPRIRAGRRKPPSRSTPPGADAARSPRAPWFSLCHGSPAMPRFSGRSSTAGGESTGALRSSYRRCFDLSCPTPRTCPTRSTRGGGSRDEPTYDVQFRAEDLWSNDADPALVHVGVFQSYLERVR